jgi:hypothetical protein
MEEPVVSLKAGQQQQSNIVEAKKSKRADLQNLSPTQIQTQTVRFEDLRADRNQKLPCVTSARSENKLANALSAALSSLPDSSSSSTYTTAACVGAGGAPPPLLDEEEERIKEASRQLKEQLKFEVQQPIQGFSLDSALHEAESPPHLNSSAVSGAAGSDEEAVMPVDISAETAITPQKATEERNNADDDNFPSPEWFLRNNVSCPNVSWWQNKTEIGLTIKVENAENVFTEIEGTNVFVFRCNVADVKYALKLSLLENISPEVVECPSLPTHVEIRLRKTEPIMWQPTLIKGDRRKVRSLDWINYDMGKSEDSDESSDDSDN